jgi:predicted mannosyl-3-phosphoglycerate phosphatase (HAD superfamily)
MKLSFREPCLRQTSSILYIAVDSLIPARGKSVPGLDEFTAALDHAGIPAVWLTSRSRLQFDDARRRLGHTHPFISEDGCVVCMPEGYFHLTPAPATPRSRSTTTVRLGRFTCIPVAEALPAAAEALESLSEETGVPVVTLRSLSPRELVQNSGLPLREAELARQRDFDELFFFAGASDSDIQRFQAEASVRKLQLRQQGVLWSVAIGASLQRCVRDLARLYDRALRYHAHNVGVATSNEAPALFPHCERSILLTDHKPEDAAEDHPLSSRARQFPLDDPDTWERLLESLSTKK